MSSQRPLIEAAWVDRKLLLNAEHAAAVREVVELLDRGELRVASKTPDGWVTHAWVKQAVLLYFALMPMQTMQAGPIEYNDKIPLKRDLAKRGVRVVPPGVVRYG